MNIAMKECIHYREESEYGHDFPEPSACAIKHHSYLTQQIPFIPSFSCSRVNLFTWATLKKETQHPLSTDLLIIDLSNLDK